ncbi:hypothetical protein [Sphaerisporangium corydalis]|uniref:HEAT repeat domain-containing protein n=1 Tax=Sphaerisporangium corydalis TaxID=1441875 RepID=A0ABV9EIF3_9ACTN|nr:hypothetical protein [Sphaerisporangium corydalis]
MSDEPSGARQEAGDRRPAEEGPRRPAADPEAKPEAEPEAEPEAKPGQEEQKPAVSSPDALEGEYEESLAPEEQMVRETLERDRRGENLRRLVSDLQDTAGADAGTFVGNQFTMGDDSRVNHAGRDFYVTYGNAGERPQATPLTKEQLARLSPSHVVSTGSLSCLTEHLGPGRVGVLSGPPGTGRTMTALAGLLHSSAQGAAEARIATFPHGIDPSRLRTGDLRESTGYLLDASGADWVRTRDDSGFRQLSYLATRTGSAFVVLVDGDTRFAPDHGEIRVVPHTAPGALAVFERCLAYRLWRSGVADGNTRARETASDPRVREELGDNSRPREAHALAGAVAQSMVDGRRLDEVLDERPQRLRECAQELLSDQGRKYERSFLLAISVLDGKSMVRTTSAALRLADLVDSVKTVPPAPGSLWSAFDETLGTWLQYAEADDDSGPDESRRRIRLRKPRLTTAVLDTAWHNHPALREPMITWLRDLTEDPDPEIRLAAAQAVGKLAVYDYAEIEKEFLSGWVRSNRVGHHWLAAWALEVTARHPAVTRQVNELLRTLADGSLARRSTAVRAYSTSLGILFFRDALTALRRAASRGRLHDEVARAMKELFLSGFRDEVIGELARWARSGEPLLDLAVHRSLTRLAMIPGEVAGDDRPSLLALLCDGDDERRVQIGLLWRSAFSDAEGNGPTWAALLHWVRCAGREPDAVHAIGALVADLGEDRRLNTALRFHLHWWGRHTISRLTAEELLPYLERRILR